MALTEANENAIEDARQEETFTRVLVGKAKTVHLTAGKTVGSEYQTLCGKVVAEMATANTKATECKTCETSAAENVETIWTEVNGEWVDMHNDDNNEETDTMAAKNTETKPSADEIAAEVKKDVENILDVISTLTKNDGDQLTSLEAQATAELMKVSASKRAGLNMRLKAALAEAKARTSTAIVKAETTTVEEIEGYEEIIDDTAIKVADGIKSEVSAQEQAKIIATAILHGRIRVFDKKGRPDLKGTRDASKKLASRIYDRAAEKLMAEGYGSEAADVDTLLDALRKKVQYQMTDVLPRWVEALDNSPEEFAELFPALVSEVSEENPASELVFGLYNIDKKSAAEKAREKRALAAQARANGGELTDGSEGGEEEDEGEGEGTEAKSQFDKDKAKVTKYTKDITAVVEHVSEYDLKQRAELNELINAQLDALTDALNKLNGK